MTFNRPTHNVIDIDGEVAFEGNYQQCLKYLVDQDNDELIMSPINSLLDENYVLGTDDLEPGNYEDED